MRALTMGSIIALLVPALTSHHECSAFIEPFSSSDHRPLFLLRRQTCLSGYSSCASLGASNACCQPNTNCQLDQGGQVACCPSNAACTGTISGPGAARGTASTAGGIILGGSTTPSVTSLATSSITSITTASNPLVTSAVTGGGSTVPNLFYPFIYLPTSYANAAACSSAVSSCQAQSTSCFNALGGSAVNGVTVSGANGGITVQGATTTVASASNVCSSLSQEACHGFSATSCSIYGGGTGTTATTNGFVVANAAPLPTMTGCVAMIYAMGAAGAVAAQAFV